MAEPVTIRPQPVQERILASSADILIAGGAAGGGKSWSLLIEPLRHHLNKEFGAVIFRRLSTHITKEGGLWDEAAKWYGHFGAVPNQVSQTYTFPSGARVSFGHLQYEKTVEEWKSAQIALLGFDQLEEFTERQFWYMLSRNRSTSGVRPYVRATCNPVPPEDETGGWLAKLIAWWIDPNTGYPIPERGGVVRWFVRDRKGRLVWGDSREELVANDPQAQPKSLTFIPAKLEDNAILEAADPGYRANLMALPLIDRERLLQGNWKIRPEAGKVFNRAWFKIVDAVPVDGEVVRYWDKAGTDESEADEKRGARSAGVRMRRSHGRYFVEHVVCGRWSAMERNRVIMQTAEADGYGVSIYHEQEPGSGGKESAENTTMQLAGYDVHADKVTDPKDARCKPMSAQAEAGNVFLLRGEWNEDFLAELHRVPAKPRDQADAAAGAFIKLSRNAGLDLALAGLSDGLTQANPWSIE